jgi:hypothetical protein
MKRTSGVLAALVVAGAASFPSAQSFSYTSGQNVAPAYEGWEQAADGAKYFVFGYMNRNWEEEIDIPVGADNSFGPGAADQGQPTHFLPRRNRFIFKVKVPAAFKEKDELIWSLTSHGKTEKAYASLRPDYILDDVVKASETGALGAGTSSPEVRANTPPTLKVEEIKARTIKVGEPLTIVTQVNDDGIPKRRGLGAGSAVRANGPAGVAESASSENTPLSNAAMRPPVRVTVGKNVGLHLSWFLYRGPAGAIVTFVPAQIKAWEDTRAGANSPWAPLWVAPALPADGKVPVHVTFSQPGTYVLRCRADDGALVADEEVTIVVTQ